MIDVDKKKVCLTLAACGGALAAVAVTKNAGKLIGVAKTVSEELFGMQFGARQPEAQAHPIDYKPTTDIHGKFQA